MLSPRPCLSIVSLDRFALDDAGFAMDVIRDPELRMLGVKGDHGELLAHWVCRRDPEAALYALADPGIRTLCDKRARSVAHVAAGAWEDAAWLAIEDSAIALMRDLVGRLVAHDAIFFWKSIAERVATGPDLGGEQNPRAAELRDYAERRIRGEDPNDPLPVIRPF